MDLIKEGHHVEISGREITDGVFGGNVRVLEKFIFAQKDAFNLIAMAAAQCIGGVARTLEAGEDLRNTDKRSKLFSDDDDLPDLPSAAGSRRVSFTKSGMHFISRGVGRTEEALEDLDKALKVMDRTQEVYIRKLADDKTSSPWREEFFMASFFEVSLREAAIEIRNLVEQAVTFEKAVSSRRMRFWLPSAPAKDFLRSADSLAVNSINPSGKMKMAKDDTIGRIRLALWDIS
ncbi:hypothetical protein HDU67_006028, partial [Dinochytrium kinnereticum]